MAPLALELIEHSTRQSSRLAACDRCSQHPWGLDVRSLDASPSKSIWALEYRHLCMIIFSHACEASPIHTCCNQDTCISAPIGTRRDVIPGRYITHRSRVEIVAQVVPIPWHLFPTKKARACALDLKRSPSIIVDDSTRSDDSPSTCAGKSPTNCPWFMQGLWSKLTSHVPNA